MADSLAITLRARTDVESDFIRIYEWCVENKCSMSAILNAYLPAIAYALSHSSFLNDTGKLFIRSDFGDVPVHIKFNGMFVKNLARKPNYSKKKKK